MRQYELCSQTATRCVFHMNLIGFRSCNAACGGRCRAAYDDGDPNCSYGSSDIGCGAVRDNQICECVRSN